MSTYTNDTINWFWSAEHGDGVKHHAVMGRRGTSEHWNRAATGGRDMRRGSYIRIVATVSLAVLGAASSPVWAQMMSLPGKFDVNASGAAAYNIAISVPPGTAGMVPSLALEYNSQSGNGLLGVGWSLSGLLSVGRCAQTMAQDGVRGGVTFTSTDRFCLDSQRLIAISGAYGGDGAEYRTEIDGFSRIISHGTTGNGPSWFEVHTKSGQVMEFGHTSDSLVLAQGKGTARSWALNKVSDAKSNYFTVTYTNDTVNGQVYPIEIDYTGNAAAGLAPNDKVQFVYATRPDIAPAYQQGSLSQTTLRLTDVKTYVGTSLVADYRLAYQNTGAVAISELTSITLCDGGGACLPATTFHTMAGGSGNFAGGTYGIPYGWAFGGPYDWGLISGDFNGDGRSDFALLQGTWVHTFISNGDGSFAAGSYAIPNGWDFADPAANGPQNNWAASCCSIVSGDFNGDGKGDFALVGSATIYLFISNGDGTFAASSYAIPYGWAFGPPGQTWTLLTGDFDGDGRTDIGFIGGPYIFTFLSRDEGTFQAKLLLLFRMVGTLISIDWKFCAHRHDCRRRRKVRSHSGEFDGSVARPHKQW